MSAIKSFLIFTALSFFFFISGLILPPAVFFFLPLSTAFLVFLFIKNGFLPGLFGSALLSAIIYRFVPFGSIYSAIFILLVVLNSLLMYRGLMTASRPWQVISNSCIAVSFVSVVVMLSFILGGFQISWVFTKISNVFPKDVAGMIKNITDNVYSIMIIFVVITTLLSYIFLSLMSKRFNVNVQKLSSFECWRLPEKFVFVFIFSILFYVVAKRMTHNVFFQISENTINVVFFLYFIGGLAIGKHFFNKSKILLFLLYFVFLLYSPSAIFLGVSDVWLDFRKKQGGNQ